MDDGSDINVNIKADASQVQPGVDAAKASIGGLEDVLTQMTAAMAAQTAAITDGFASMAKASNTASAQIKADSAAEEISIMGVANSVKGMVVAVDELETALVGVGELLMAVFAIQEITEFAQKMGEAGIQMAHMAETMGVPISQMAQLEATATMTGTSMHSLELAAVRVDAAFVRAEEGSKRQAIAFNTLGISLDKPMSSADLLQTVLEKLSSMSDTGINKNAIAAELLGHNLAGLAGILNMTSEQIADINRQTVEYGLGNEAAYQNMAQLGEAFNENKNAMQGLFLVMAQELAPTLTVVVQGVNGMIASMIKSYESGGTMYDIMQLLVAATKGLIETIAALGLAFDLTFKTSLAALDVLGGTFGAVMTWIAGWLQVGETALITFGKIANDVFTLNFDQISDDWKSGISKMSATLTASSEVMGRDFAAGFSHGAQTFMSQGSDIMGFAKFTDNLMSGTPHKQVDLPSGKDDKTNPPLDTTAKGKGQVAQWEEDLHQQEEASKDFFNDQTADELAFWESKIGLTKDKSQERLAVESKIYDAQKTLAHQAYDAQLATDKDQIEQDKGNKAAELADWDKYMSDVAAKYKQDSKEYQDAAREKAAAVRAIEEQAAAAQQKRIEDQTKMQVSAIQAQSKAEQAAADLQLKLDEDLLGSSIFTLGQENALQVDAATKKYALEKETADKVYAVQLDALTRQAAIPNLSATAEASINAQRLALQQQYNSQSLDLEVQHQQTLAAAAMANLQRTQAEYHSVIDGIVSSWGSGIEGLINRTETWGQAVTKVGENILSQMINIVEKMVERWIVGEMTKTQVTAAQAAAQNAALAAQSVGSLGTSATVAIADITNSAARASAGAFASTAAIPIVGPGLAPAAAATADAQVLSLLGQVASFDVGTNYVPNDMLAMIHEGERIVPAADNRQLMGALGGSSNTTNNTGDTHYHIHQQPGESSEALVGRLRKAARQGHIRSDMFT